MFTIVFRSTDPIGIVAMRIKFILAAAAGSAVINNAATQADPISFSDVFYVSLPQGFAVSAPTRAEPNNY